MPQYLYQVAYTAESLAAQIKKPEDRMKLVGGLIEKAVGAKIVGGGYSYGEYDLTMIIDAPDDVTMAAVAVAIGAGGAVKSSRTTPLLTGGQWVGALEKASKVTVTYQPSR